MDPDRGTIIGLSVALAVLAAGILVLGIMVAVSASLFTKNQIKTVMDPVSSTFPWVKIGQSLSTQVNSSKAQYGLDHLFNFSPTPQSVTSAPNSSTWQIVPDYFIGPNGQQVNSLYFVNLSSNQARPNVWMKQVMAYDGNFGSVCVNQNAQSGWQSTYNAALNVPYSSACPSAISSSQCSCDPNAGSCAQCPAGQICTGGLCNSGGGFAGNYIQIGSWVIFPEQIPNGSDGYLDALSFATNQGQRAKFQMSDVGNFVGLCGNGNTVAGFNIINNAQGSGGFPNPPCGYFTNNGPQQCYQGFGQTCSGVPGCSSFSGQCCNNADCGTSTPVCVQGTCKFLQPEQITTQTLNIGKWQITEKLFNPSQYGGVTSELRFINPNGQYFAMQDTGQFLSVCANGTVMGSLTWNTLYPYHDGNGNLLNSPNGQVPGINFQC